MPINIEDLRRDYSAGELEVSDVSTDPIVQFRKWFEEAVQAEVPEPNAMTLSTASPEGKPSARIVLLKGIESGAFRFYTNYNSRKGQELSSNPHVALTFLWHELQRQVRIEGTAALLPEEVSQAYFQSRPKGSQIGAWASPQSEIIEGRAVLERNVSKLQEEYSAADALPKPPHWGGYGVKPSYVEFWQGRSSRLHDRVAYTLQGDGQWLRQRLAP